MAYLGLHIVWSPDLDEICAAIGDVARTIEAAGMGDDPRVTTLTQAIVKRLYSGEAIHLDFNGGEAVASIGDDELLKLLAQWQALKGVAVARLQARGWRT